MSKEPWVCPTCKTSFKTEEDLKAHSKSAHPPIPRLAILTILSIGIIMGVGVAAVIVFLVVKPETAFLNVFTAVCCGILGGFTHDVVQNKRTWQKPVRTKEGIVLGSAVGLLLGAVSGLLVGLALPSTEGLQMAAYTGLSAGLSLKGLAEAAGTEQPKEQTKPGPT